jgi:hypothetical protein
MSQDDVKPTRDWRTIAALVASETDRERVLSLAQELIKPLDENSNRVMGQVTAESKKSAA